jgi:hypothetical protein
MPMSPEECLARAEDCERMAQSLGPDSAHLRDTMREIAAMAQTCRRRQGARHQALGLGVFAT